MLLHIHFIDAETKVNVLSDLPKLAIGGGSVLPREGLASSEDFLGGQENGEKLDLERSSAMMAGISQFEGTLREMKHLQLLGAPKGRVCPVGRLGLC